MNLAEGFGFVLPRKGFADFVLIELYLFQIGSRQIVLEREDRNLAARDHLAVVEELDVLLVELFHRRGAALTDDELPDVVLVQPEGWRMDQTALTNGLFKVREGGRFEPLTLAGSDRDFAKVDVHLELPGCRKVPARSE